MRCFEIERDIKTVVGERQARRAATDEIEVGYPVSLPAELSTRRLAGMVSVSYSEDVRGLVVSRDQPKI